MPDPDSSPARGRTVRTSGTSAALVDPKAKQMLEVAAEAAGLSLEQLVDLVHDSGAIVAPPADGITERYTLEDLGVRLRTALAEVPMGGKPKWFKQLVDTQQAALIVHLRTRGYSSMAIARDFEVDQLEVQHAYNRYSDKVGSQVVNIRLDTIAGQLQLAAERAAEGAAAKDDFSTYWRIHKEMIALLQSLGIVDKAIHRVEVTHNFDDQSKQEIQMMLDVERKRQARQEEIKQADAIVLDATPDELDTPPSALPAPTEHTMEQPYEGD